MLRNAVRVVSRSIATQTVGTSHLQLRLLTAASHLSKPPYERNVSTPRHDGVRWADDSRRQPRDKPQPVLSRKLISTIEERLNALGKDDDRLLEAFKELEPKVAPSELLQRYCNAVQKAVADPRSHKKGLANHKQLRQAYDAKGVTGIDEALLEHGSYWAALQTSSPEVLAEQERLADMTRPEDWYPQARQLRRKLIMHVGPTNSGKTYNALQRLKQAESGCFAGPLRLLAFEIYDRFNAEGVKCNLTTGEERRIDDSVRLTSSTIEMLSLGQEIDVLVIDEIQMIADPERGSAWTQALLGCPAKEIHMCGEESAVELVQRIAKSLGEEVEVKRYNRLGQLQPLNKSLEGTFQQIEDGDAVVTFSRRNIFDVKRNIEQVTGRKCAVVYGGLPPETRAAQAKLFNDPSSDFNVMVASDAIGMGLNLSIRRVVFETMEKWDGKQSVTLPVPQIKQIAGRAGRFRARVAEAGVETPKEQPGYVTTLRQSDLSILHDALAQPIVPLARAVIKPPVELVERFINTFPVKARLSNAIRRMQLLAKTADDKYEVSDMRRGATAMDLIHPITDLSFRERWTLIDCPLRSRDEAQVAAFLQLCRHLADGSPAEILSMDAVDVDLLDEPLPRTQERLAKLESLHAQVVAYLWLANRFPGTYTGIADAFQLKLICEQTIQAALENMKAARRTAGRQAKAQFVSTDTYLKNKRLKQERLDSYGQRSRYGSGGERRRRRQDDYDRPPRRSGGRDARL